MRNELTEERQASEMKKLRLWLLCAVLIVTMSACNGGGSETEPANTSVPATTAELTTEEPTTEEATEPEPTAQELYDQALTLLDEMDSMKLEISVEKTTVLGTEKFGEKYTQTLILQNVGSESFAASLKDTTYFGDYCVKTEELFSGGTMYFKVYPVGMKDAVDYRTAMTAEDYMERMIPAQLLDAGLYQTVEKSSGSNLTFSEGLAPEAWLHIGEDDLVKSSGSITLNSVGEISSSVYAVTYMLGSAEISEKYTVNISSDVGAPIAASTSADQYQVLEGDAYYAPYLMQRAIGYISQMKTVASEISVSAASAAAAWGYEQQSTINLYSDGTEELGDIEYVYQLYDIQTGEYYFNDVVKETYADGIYTYTYNQDVPESQNMAYAYYSDSVSNQIATLVPRQSYVKSYIVGNYNGTFLVEYELNEAADETLVLGTTSLMFEDPNLLDSMATAYRTELAEGYVGIDAATGIPTAMAMDFVGVHTIEGVEYKLAYSLVMNCQVGHESTYEEITGEPLPEENTGEKATPLFYKVTGANGQEMWLLGTIHVGDERTANLPQAVWDAFAASDALAVEFDVDAFEERLETDEEFMTQFAQMYLYADGTTTQNHISDTELYEYAVNLMKAAGQWNSTMEMFKTFAWSQVVDDYLLNWNYDLSGEYGMDSRLLEMAREQNKTILDVESGMEQMQMYAGFSDALQELLLAESLSGTPIEYGEQVNELYELWCEGDEEVLIAYITDNDTSELTAEELVLYEEYTKAMETDRNAKMLEAAKGYLESGDVVFYAVGLAHLLAEDGLVNTLRDAGYTVELVGY